MSVLKHPYAPESASNCVAAGTGVARFDPWAVSLNKFKEHGMSAERPCKAMLRYFLRFLDLFSLKYDHYDHVSSSTVF
jgi:hypothetical protein